MAANQAVGPCDDIAGRLTAEAEQGDKERRASWLVMAVVVGLAALPLASVLLLAVFLAENMSDVARALPSSRTSASVWAFALAALAAGAAGAIVYWRATSGGCSTDEHGHLQARLAELRQNLDNTRSWLTSGAADGASWDGWCTSDAHARRLEQLLTSRRPDLRWVTADGYINAWRELHRAEEALLSSARIPALVHAASDLDLRLHQSGVPGLDLLTDKLRLAMTSIQPVAVPFLTAAPATTAQTTTPQQVPPQEDGRAILRNVCQALNEYRDDIWAGLVYTRNLLLAKVAAGWLLVAVLLLSLVLGGASPGGLLTAGLIFLAGALAGAIGDISQQSLQQSSQQDYGLGSARLLANVLMAGLAAVAGVVLVQFLGLSIVGQQFAASAAHLNSGAAAAARAGTGAMDWSQVFDLSSNGIGFVVALTFGFTPVRLFNLLQGDQASAMQALRSTQRTGGPS